MKIVLIIDEFDKLNEEFFFPGPIGDAFSLGLGKNVQSEDRVSVILVGAENMKLLDYHQMNYNEFIDLKVDFFDKKTQYSDFIDLVQYPVKEYIKFTISFACFLVATNKTFLPDLAKTHKYW